MCIFNYFNILTFCRLPAGSPKCGSKKSKKKIHLLSLWIKILGNNKKSHRLLLIYFVKIFWPGQQASGDETAEGAAPVRAAVGVDDLSIGLLRRLLRHSAHAHRLICGLYDLLKLKI